MIELKQHRLGADLIGTINILRSNRLSVLTAINEFVDNSLDAGATEIRIIESGNDLIIRDNGSGFESLGDSVLIGRSPKKGHKKIGRHGVGMKAACIKFSTATTIRSKGREIYVPWNDVITELAQPLFDEEVVTGSKYGTEIILHNFLKMRSTQAVQPHLLAKTYAMLIYYNQAKILLNGESLEVPDLPDIKNALDQDIFWRGRAARVIGGTYATDDPMRRSWSGYYAYYNGRLISGNILEHGRGDYCCSNFVYRIFLNDGDASWKLSTHKDEVDELNEFINYLFDSYTGDAIAEAATEAEVIELKDIQKSINDFLNGKKGNGTRGPNKNLGSVQVKNTGRRRRRTTKPNAVGVYDAEGNGSEDKSPKGIEFIYERMDGETLGLCEKRKGSKRSWKFNLNNSFVDTFKTQKEVIAPLVVFFNEFCNSTNEKELFAEEVLTSVLERTGEHLHSTENQYITNQ